MSRFISTLLVVTLACLAPSHAPALDLAKADGQTIIFDHLDFLINIRESPLLDLRLTEASFDQEELPFDRTARDLIADHVALTRIAEKHAVEIDTTSEIRMHALVEIASWVSSQLRSSPPGLEPVTDEEIERFYEETRESHHTIPEQVHAALIYRPSTEDAAHNDEQRQLLLDLRAKPDVVENFARYAREYSLSPSAEQGGELGWVTRGRINPRLETAAFNLTPPDVSGIEETDKGYFLVKVSDYQTTQTLSLSETRPKLRSILERMKSQEAWDAWLGQLAQEHNFKTWRGADPPKPDEVVVEYGDTSLTASDIEAAWPEMTGAPNGSAYTKRLDGLVIPLLVHHDFLNNTERNKLIPAWKYEIYSAEQRGIAWLWYDFYRNADDLEAQARKYYDDHPGIYHTPVPVDLDVLEFVVPDLTERNLKLVEAERGRRLINTLHDTAVHDSWEKAVAAGERSEHVAHSGTGLIHEYPGGWTTRKLFVELTSGFISKPFATPNGYAFFRVAEIGEYTVLPYEEIADKPLRVVTWLGFKEHREELTSRLLEESPVTFYFGESED